MDPVSAMASIIAIYQLASEVGKICFHYAQGVKHANRESDFVLDEITKFQKSLQNLRGMLVNEEGIKGGADRLKNLREIMEGDSAYLRVCKSDLEDLRKKLEKGIVGEGKREAIRAVIYKLSWPLKEEEVNKVCERLRNVAAAIDRAYNMDGIEMIRVIDTNTKDLISTTKRMETAQVTAESKRKLDDEQRKREEEREDIIKWLAHPDKAENHNIACHARNDTAKTGRWFLDGATFQEFKDTPGSLLWLHGDSGCGKTILCSAIIEELRTLQSGDKQIDIAYWYFYANDKKRTTLNNLVRALITELIPPAAVPPVLVDFWKAKRRGMETPKTPDLIQILQNMLIDKAHQTCYIVLDALDESDESERDELMEMLRNILSSENVKIHVLVTSRTNTTGVEKALEALTRFYNIAIERECVDQDILAHITERLENDRVLKRWPEKERKKIKDSLMEKAAGMFRWVDCQLQAIRKCKKPADLNRTLTTLPKDVHEQYTRELENIAENSSQDALQILKWLTFPQRKLRIEEAVDMIAVDMNQDPPVFDLDSRMYDPEDVLEVCGSLVRKDINPEGRNSLGVVGEVQTLTTAHGTVSDYLKSQTLRIGSEPAIRFTRSAVNLEMAETCLTYLRYFTDNSIEMNERNVNDYPLARFSAEFWDDHYREVIANDQEKVDMTRLNTMVMNLFRSPDAMLNWIRLCDPDRDTAPADFNKNPSDVKSPIYYAALLGLPDIVSQLIDEGANINQTYGSGYGTPLVSASALGRREVVSLLLEKGADVNLSGYWWWGCPLAAAVEMNEKEILNMLLSSPGIDINCRRAPSRSREEAAMEIAKEVTENATANLGELGDTEQGAEAGRARGAVDGSSKGIDGSEVADYDDNIASESMVYIAAAYNSPDTLKILLDAGADINMEGGEYCTGLQAASAWGHEDIVKRLLDKGAKVDVYGGIYGDPLQAASNNGFPEIVKKLIAAGSDVNRVGGVYGCALYAACDYEDEKVVEILLDEGADPNIQGCGKYDNALHQACTKGNEKIVHLLLDKGADPNLHGGEFGNAFQAACFSGNENIVRLLLEGGSDAKYRGGYFDNALQAGIKGGSEAVVRLVVEAGVSVNIRGGPDTYPVLSASILSPTHDAILLYLLNEGADPNLECEGDDVTVPCRTCLQLAASESIAAMLLDHGASINVQTGYICTALHSAALRGSRELVELLINRGADVNIVHWSHGSPLSLACGRGELDIARLLIENGAKIDAFNMAGQDPLYLALIYSNWEIFDYLFELGADSLRADKRGCNGLHYAARASRYDVVERILKCGASVDDIDSNGWSPLHWASASGHGSAKVIKTLLKAGVNKDLKDQQGRTALDLALLFQKEEEAAILQTEGQAYYDLPEINDQKKLRPSTFICGGCGDVRGDHEPECQYHCKACLYFDLCFRCILDKDIIHPKDHEFITGYIHQYD